MSISNIETGRVTLGLTDALLLFCCSSFSLSELVLS